MHILLYILITNPIKTMNTSSEVEIYKTILAEQKGTYDTIVYVWIAITAILITGTLFWNFFIADLKIESAVEIKTKKLTESFEKSFTDLNEKLENKFVTAKEEFSSKIKSLSEESSKQLNAEVANGLQKNEREFERIWGDIHRSFKTIAQLDKQFDSVIERCFFAMMHYHKAEGHETTIGELIDDLKSVLNKPETIELVKNNPKFLIDEYISCAENFIPDTSGSTKAFIISKLKACKQQQQLPLTATTTDLEQLA
jgi:hypothetical protein